MHESAARLRPKPRAARRVDRTRCRACRRRFTDDDYGLRSAVDIDDTLDDGEACLSCEEEFDRAAACGEAPEIELCGMDYYGRYD